MRSREEVEELLDESSDIPRLLLLPWCTAPKSYCKEANYDCGNCNSAYKKMALRRLETDFQAFKSFKT